MSEERIPRIIIENCTVSETMVADAKDDSVLIVLGPLTFRRKRGLPDSFVEIVVRNNEFDGISVPDLDPSE